MGKRTVGLLLVLGLSNFAYASGFSLTEQSASALGRGSTASAHTDEPASAWYNPAALPFGASQGIALTGMAYAPRFFFAPNSGGTETKSDASLHAIPALDAHAALKPSVRLGLGVHVPYALNVPWPKDWIGARHAIFTRVRALAINPSLAIRVHSRLALAGGVSAIRGVVENSTAYPAQLGEGKVDLAGSTWGPGVNLAVFCQAWSETLDLAATYRSRTRLNFKGRATFLPEVASIGFVAQGARATITFPDLITLGAKLATSQNLALLLEIERTLWSSFERLTITLDQPNVRLPPIERARLDPWGLRGGLEWLGLQKALVLRAGIGFEQSTANPETLSPSGPDSHRWAFSGGIGYRWEGWSLDLGYKFTYFLAATANPPAVRPDGFDPAQSPAGTYRVRTHLLALTLGHRRN